MSKAHKSQFSFGTSPALFYRKQAPLHKLSSGVTGSQDAADETIRVGDVILSGLKQELAFSVYHAADVPPMLLRDYALLLASTKTRFPAEVRNVQMDELVEGDNLIVFVTSSTGLEAASYAKRFRNKDGTNLKFCGFCSYGNIKGAGVNMIAALTVAEEHTALETPNGIAIARRYKDRSLNEASTGPFGEMGFRGVRDFDEKITVADIHMFDEMTFRADGPYIGCHLMHGKASKIGPRAWNVLSNWELTWGKSFMEEASIKFVSARDNG